MTSYFKPENSALLLIDYQVGTLQICKTTPSDVALRSAVTLAKAALAFDMPVVLTASQEDQIQGPVAEALQRVLPKAYASRIQRVGIVNCWDDPKFKKAVVDTGRRQLIMGGITTDICLIFPAISAVKDGFEVQAVIDASGSPFEISEEMARRRMEAAGVTLTATNTIVAELVHDWATKQGGKLVPLLFASAPMVKVA
jgi:nicotinamidase-related amidase